ncbi:basement membrane-specific heparan sulfate proteoglycan core protein [Orussus abietinus]|uniref:basement membrane-specific heparan sulfate proteoglycan core protein n=1 Tax=Orussus abietinus TaxID=222816 RepID=UPI000C71621C|nr:basement membrane-specific heparan sulfate proteoglycan core protein [Orussus abietinus]
MHGMWKIVALWLAVALVVYARADENDDLVFDQDLRQSVVEVPLIEKQTEDSIFHRIKRGLFDWFKPVTETPKVTTTEEPPAMTYPPTTEEEEEDDREKNLPVDDPLNYLHSRNSNSGNESTSVGSSAPKSEAHTSRVPRESGEENQVDSENPGAKNGDRHSDIGEVAEGRRVASNYPDDEDFPGSGEVEGSAVDPELNGRHGPHTEIPRTGGKAQFYRVTLTVSEPYRREYADRNSQEYRELSANLTQALENLYALRVPDYKHFASVVKISPTSDAFTSQVTLDIGSTFSDELEVREILERQLRVHSLGNIQVSPEGFTFRIFEAPEHGQECDQSTELRCRNGDCVPLDSRCDGVSQCSDFSDEQDCPTTETETPRSSFDTTPFYHPERHTLPPFLEGSETTTERPEVDYDITDEPITRPPPDSCRGDDTVRCEDGSRYICSIQQCDGIQDCDDGGDEVGCPHPGCSAGEFACDVVRCILQSQRCDFHEDCQDGSDEHDCEYPACGSQEFRCRNGQCIESSKQCNGVQDCYDRSDEVNCPCRKDEFECSPGYCLPESRRCDNTMDCQNGIDEQGCQDHSTCRPEEFQCADGPCVSKSARCDGRSDCRDYSDEYNCNVTTCSGDQFRCRDGICLSIDKRCNGVADCRNGEDESQCGCGAKDFRCANDRCIDYELQCNGVNDCLDGSDEKDCEKSLVTAPWKNVYNDVRLFREYMKKREESRSSKHPSLVKPFERYSSKMASQTRQGKTLRRPSDNTKSIHDSWEVDPEKLLEIFPEFGKAPRGRLKLANENGTLKSPKDEWESVRQGPKIDPEELGKRMREIPRPNRNLGNNYIEDPILESFPQLGIWKPKSPLRWKIQNKRKKMLKKGSHEIGGNSRRKNHRKSVVPREPSKSGGPGSRGSSSRSKNSLEMKSKETSVEKNNSGRRRKLPLPKGAANRYYEKHLKNLTTTLKTTLKTTTSGPEIGNKGTDLSTLKSTDEVEASTMTESKENTKGAFNDGEENEVEFTSSNLSTFFVTESSSSGSTEDQFEVVTFKDIGNEKTAHYDSSSDPDLVTTAKMTSTTPSTISTEIIVNGYKIKPGSKVEKYYKKYLTNLTPSPPRSTTKVEETSTSKMPSNSSRSEKVQISTTVATKLGEKVAEEVSRKRKKHGKKKHRNGKDDVSKTTLKSTVSAITEATTVIKEPDKNLTEKSSQSSSNSTLDETLQGPVLEVENSTSTSSSCENDEKCKNKCGNDSSGKKGDKVKGSESNDIDSGGTNSKLGEECSETKSGGKVKENSTESVELFNQTTENPLTTLKSVSVKNEWNSTTLSKDHVTDNSIKIELTTSAALDKNKGNGKGKKNRKNKGGNKKRNGKRTSKRGKVKPTAAAILDSRSEETTLPMNTLTATENDNITVSPRSESTSQESSTKSTSTFEMLKKDDSLENEVDGNNTKIDVDSRDVKLESEEIKENEIENGKGIESENNIYRSETKSETPKKKKELEEENEKVEIEGGTKEDKGTASKEEAKEVSSSTEEEKDSMGTSDAEEVQEEDDNKTPKSTTSSKWDAEESKTENNSEANTKKNVYESSSREPQIASTRYVLKSSENLKSGVPKSLNSTERRKYSSTSPSPRTTTMKKFVKLEAVTENFFREEVSMNQGDLPPSPEEGDEDSPDWGNCRDDQHFCGELCIEEDLLCDGEEDCKDGSDEWGCDYYIDLKKKYLRQQMLKSHFGQVDPRLARVRGCAEFQHFCDSKCLEERKVCDGIDDCSDGSDEDFCEYYDYEGRGEKLKSLAPCPSMDFTCGDGSCIPNSSVCDGFDDCPMAEDELHCERGCTLTQFECASGGKCIEGVYRCDGHWDCPDRSDEKSCPSRTNETAVHIGSPTNPPWPAWVVDRSECDPETKMRCDNGQCLLRQRKCDGIIHCLDGSDERGCGDCATDEWKCENGECLPEKQRCDGVPQCPDASDETGCGNSCPDGQLPCDNGVCIMKSFFCDNNKDCHDGSDEKDCPYPGPDLESRPVHCREDEFTCHDRRQCVSRSAVCNGQADCHDSSDERDCRRGCTRDQFQCRNGDCVRGDQRCNRIYECDDGSDEDNCGPLEPSTPRPEGPGTHPMPGRCPAGLIMCAFDKNCVPHSSLCNGIPECRDGSDEENCAVSGGELNLKTYPSEQIIKESREVVFQCRDEGPLRARVQWTRGNGHPLPPGSRDVNGRLEIPNIQLEHGGPYICEAVGYAPHTPDSKVTVYLTVEKFDLPSTRPPQVCKYDEATCSNGDCIPKSYVCDNKFDCTDGSDESRCSPHGCEPNEFRCANKQCVIKTWRCDGDKDCADGTDEENCTPSPPGSPCRYDEFQCTTNDQCIPKSYHCDMERDCMDGSDELGCSPVYITKAPPPMVVLMPGEAMILTCSAVGVPIPEINWRLNWGHIPAKCTTTSINGTGTLTCPDIQISDQGAYSCEALNVGGFVFAVPDAILVVKTEPVCPKGSFNDDARSPEECISCFCFGVATECQSANLFTYRLTPPFDRHKLVSVKVAPEIRINGDIGNRVREISPVGQAGVKIQTPYIEEEFNSYNVPYFALPEFYHGIRLKSYGGYLKYTVTYSGGGLPLAGPSVILSGNNYTLLHTGPEFPSDYESQQSVRFFYGEWYKSDGRHEVLASREEIMMTLLNVDNILIKAKYENGPQLDTTISDIVMDTADERNTGLGSASFVEKCECPAGYTGDSCENCAAGFERHKSGRWLGLCYSDRPPCPPGYYGDPSRNIPCRLCPCPLTNPANQVTRICHLGSNGEPKCECPPGYKGDRCESCEEGYRGNPLVAGDMCVPNLPCHPEGSISPYADPVTGQCHCKPLTTGLTCDKCKPNTFHLASNNQFRCISCFCMGVTNKCSSSNWYRNEIRVSFINSIRDFSLVESSSDSEPIVHGIHLDTVGREIVYNDFPNRGKNDVYYWQLPSIFLGDHISSYGGNLKYTVRYVPSPGGQSSRNNAPDVELLSDNDLRLFHYSREAPEPNIPQSFTVPLLEQYWQQSDGTPVEREHLLMALADVRAIGIKATYTTHTDEAALSHVTLDTAEKYNTGRSRAAEVEECSCPPGYKGLSCEDCDVGYARSSSGSYLGICEPCQCNGHSNQCDPETGICENCADHTTGDNCERCEYQYEGDATRGTPQDCQPRGSSQYKCNCTRAGSRDTSCVNNQCECKANVEGPNCDRCRPSTFGLSESNIDGCIDCYCSGVTDQCHESSLFIQQIPVWVYDSHHGFTLTDSTRRDIIDNGFELNLGTNEIGYRYPGNRSRRLFWSLPPNFTGNRVKSYGGNLTMTQHITAYPGAISQKDQDVLLVGNGITLYWTNPQELQPDIPLTYSVPLKESEWRRLTVEGPRTASRTDLMTVLSNLEAILVRASHSENMLATYISDISLDTAVENTVGGRRATQVEACRCRPGYVGTSCESCARGYYRDISDRSLSYLGACNPCPCNGNEESCEISRSGHVKCHCLPRYTGQYCQSLGELRVSLMPVKVRAEPNSVVKFKCTYDHAEGLYVYFKLTSSRGDPITEWDMDPGPLRRTENGGFREWSVRAGRLPCYVECHVLDRNGTELVTITTSMSPVDEYLTPEPPVPTISPPRILVSIREPEFQIVHTGNTVRYHCSAKSTDSTTFHIKWEKEGGQLPTDRSFDDAHGLLVIRDVKVSDSGVYVCQVNDGVNIGIKRVTLAVGGVNPVEPRATISPRYLRIKEGEPAEFRCEATGNPPPEVNWIRVHGDMNPEATFYNGIWRVPAVLKTDAAEYKCIARNSIGVDNQTTILYVLDNPDRPRPTAIPSVRPTVVPPEWTGNSGNAVRLVCSSAYEARISWTRAGNVPLPNSADQREGVLTISNPTSDDSGVYICTATSYQGTETSNTAQITIMVPREPPSVKVKPERQVVSQGTVAEVRCITSREPGLQIKWSKYGEASMGQNVQQVGDMLRIVNPQVPDRGVYVCRVTSSRGSQEASAIIEVAPREEPVLELYPQQIQVVLVGGSADLQCRAIAGFPIPEIHWSREDGRHFGSNIEQLPGGLLRLTNITISDGGAFVCSASNEVGTTTAVAHIEVQSLPVITISPNIGILPVKLGDRIRLMCSATGHPQPNVVWSRHTNGVALYGPLDRTAATPLSAVYEIFSVSPDDEGSYTCQATNAAGITEERVQIRIEDTPTYPCRGDQCAPTDEGPSVYPVGNRNPNGGIHIPETSLRIPNGGNVEMRCQVVGLDDDKIYLDWRRSDHRPLPEGSTVHNGVLRIPAMTKEAAGEYFCLGLNPDGNVLFKEKSHLEIISPPRIELNPTSQTVRPGENPSIICTATGDQPLNIKWDAIGRSLPHSVTDNRGLLQFHGIAFADAGKYVCKATNDAGTAEAVAEVLVNEHVFENTPVHALERDITTYSGNSLTLRCQVREHAQILWSREGQSLPANSRVRENQLELMHVTPEDSGRYICEVRNNHGVASDYINVRVALYPMQCRHGEYRCRSEECIRLDFFCDGYAQCSDGSDERFCRSRRYRQILQRRRAAATPTISIEVAQDPINIGDTIDIRCSYSGGHNPRFHWVRPNQISLPSNAEEYGNVLRLSNVAVSESGVYRCIVETPEGTFEDDFNLIVQGGTNDAPAIETKYARYGTDVQIDCKTDLRNDVKYQWNKLGGLLPEFTQFSENMMFLKNVKAEDAGTYICTANSDQTSVEVPTMLVVTGVVPNFTQAPQSYIALPPLPDAYLKFTIEVSFKPERYDGIILYNDEKSNGSGDFLILALVGGYPVFKFHLGSDPAEIRANRPITLGKWHTIKLQRNRREGTMFVDGEGPYEGSAAGRRQGLDLMEPLYIGGVKEYSAISKYAGANSGFVGCIGRLVIGEKQVDLMSHQATSVGVTTCETCAENPCNNGGVCQEAASKHGYTCLCRAGYSGKHCDFVGQSCYPGACGEGKCVDKEDGFVCYCRYDKTGPRCERSISVYDPAFHNDHAFLSYQTPKAIRRLKLTMNFNPSDNGDGILMYSAQVDEGLGDFVALVIKDKHVEFRFDVGSGTAIIRSSYIVQPGIWTHVTISRDFKVGNLSVNGEPQIEGRSPGTARTMTLNTPLYIGGVDRRRITVNKNVGVDKGFRGCVNELEVSSMNVDILKSSTDSANVEDCSLHRQIQTASRPPSTEPPTTPSTTEYNPCMSNPCVHGICQSTSTYEYSCTCEYGYVGRNCENVLKQCELLSPCKNNGFCTDLRGSYKCDCRLGYNGLNCEKPAEISYDVAFKGDGWLELDRSVMPHTEEREVLGFEISTNKSNGLIMWHGQTPNDLNPEDYIALAVVDGYIEYQYNLGSGPAVIRVMAQRVDDGERYRIILKRQGSDGSIELNGEHTESGVSDGLQQILNTRGSVYLGGVPDYLMTYGRYHDGFSGCIYTLEVQDSGAIDIGNKAIRGKNVSPCTKARWIPSSLVFTDADADIFDAFVPPPPVNIIHPRPTVNRSSHNVKSIPTLIIVQHLVSLSTNIRHRRLTLTLLCVSFVILGTNLSN